MVFAFVLIAGVVLILVVAAVLFTWLGMPSVLSCLVPTAPWLVMMGTLLLSIVECLLFFGSKEDRRSAKRDLIYLVPTFAASAVLWWLLQKFFW